MEPIPQHDAWKTSLPEPAEPDTGWLKPCPHCKESGDRLDYGGGGARTYVYCGCGARGPIAVGWFGAGNAWNKRELYADMIPRSQAWAYH